MQGTTYFQGSEFDWLRQQVAGVLWQPRSGNGQWLETAPADIRIPFVSPPRRRGAMGDPTPLRTLAIPETPLSVEQYNAFRGSHPDRAQALPYVYQEYPVMLYRGDGKKTVRTVQEHEDALKAGYRQKQ